MYKYLAFKSLEADDRGQFYCPRDFFRFGKPGGRLFAGIDGPAEDGILASFSWEEEAENASFVALVIPYFDFVDQEADFILISDYWLSNSAEVVAGPFPSDSEEGKKEAARIILKSYQDGYPQDWGIVLWALRQLAGELPPDVITAILDRFVIGGFAAKYADHIYELAFVPALAPYLGGVRKTLRRMIKAGDYTRAVVSAYCALSGFSPKACKYIASLGWDIGGLLIKEALYNWAADPRVGRRPTKWVIRNLGFPANPWEGAAFELSGSVLTHVKGSGNPDLLKYTDALIMRALKDDSIPFPPNGIFYLMDRGKLGLLDEISSEISSKKLGELFQAYWHPRYDILFDIVQRCLQRPEEDIWGVILYWAPQKFDWPWISLINEIVRAINRPDLRPHAERLLTSYRAVCGDEELPYKVKEFLSRLNQALEKNK